MEEYEKVYNLRDVWQSLESPGHWYDFRKLAMQCGIIDPGKYRPIRVSKIEAAVIIREFYRRRGERMERKLANAKRGGHRRRLAQLRQRAAEQKRPEEA